MLFTKSTLLLSLHCLLGACSNYSSGDKPKPLVIPQNLAPVQLNNSNSANVSFDTPETTGQLSFTVSVSDNKGASSSETINIDIIGLLVGSWSREGYHQFLDIDTQQISLLEYTPDTKDPVSGWCYKAAEIPTGDFQEVAPVTFNEDYQRMSFNARDFGDDGGRRYYQKLSQLPEACQNGGMLTADDPNFSGDATDDFQLFWHAFQTHYPFFELRNKDWQKEYDQHVGLVNSDTSAEELAEAFSSMLNNISDGHVGVSLNDEYVDINNGWFEAGVFQRIKTQFEAQKDNNDGITDFLDYYFARIDIFHDIIADKYVDIEQIVPLAEESLMAWGKFSPEGQSNIGYLRVGIFEIEDSDNGIKQGYQDYMDAIDSAMTSLQSTDALIIDIRLNSGGSEAITFYLANYFADQHRHAFNKQVQDINGLSEAVAFYITPHSNKSLYHKPVRILTDAGTASAAEAFAIMMRSLNQVKIIGERSAGDIAGQLEKWLPFSLMELRIPNKVYTTFDNKVFENIGVQVDNLVLDFTAEDLLLEKDSVLDAALNTLK